MCLMHPRLDRSYFQEYFKPVIVEIVTPIQK